MGKKDPGQKPAKVRERVITRAHALKALTAGDDPNKYVKHGNCHVRRRAWQLMGRPLPEGTEEQNKFLATLQGTETPKDASKVPAFYASLRQRILKEAPPVEETASEVPATVQDS